MYNELIYSLLIYKGKFYWLLTYSMYYKSIIQKQNYMSTIEIIIVINAMITLACLLIQAHGIKKGVYDSSLASWSIWSLIFLFSFIIYCAKDGLTTMVWLLGVQTIGHIIMIPITYKYSVKIISKEEKKLVWISIGGFILWGFSLLLSYIFEINFLIPTIIGICGQIIADAMGAIPYLRIVYHTPFRQPIAAWILNVFIYPLTIYGTIIAKESWTAYIFIIYAWIIYSGMLIMLFIGRQRKWKKNLAGFLPAFF